MDHMAQVGMAQCIIGKQTSKSLTALRGGFWYHVDMKWKKPNIAKVYKALAILADDRIERSGNTAKVYSSDREKFYTVEYDPEYNVISSNDSGSYWQGYLAHPSIALLMDLGIINFNKKLTRYLKGFNWKSIMDEYKHDYPAGLEFVKTEVLKKHPDFDYDNLEVECQRILDEAMALKLQKPAKRPRLA